MPEDHGPPWGPNRRWGRDSRRGCATAGSTRGGGSAEASWACFLLVVLLVAALASRRWPRWRAAPHPKPCFTIAIAALVLVGLLVAARWLWRSARSIGSLMDAADRVAGGDYTTRVGEVPGRPYQRLAGAFDEMTSRLQTNEERRRELLADVAHELRTPLQAIRGATEGMLDGLYPLDAEHLRPVIERDRRDGAAARRPAHALDGRGRRAGAPSGDRRSARRGRGRREGAARRRR